MSSTKLTILGIILSLFLALTTSRQITVCNPSSCGALTNISYPFRLKGDPARCGDPSYELACENNHTILHDDMFGDFYVQKISYVQNRQTIRVLDLSLESEKCWVLPRTYLCGFGDFIYFVSCRKPMNSPLYIDASACANGSSSSSGSYFYALLSGGTINATGFDESCTVQVQVPRSAEFGSSNSTDSGLSILDVQREILKGYEVSWSCAYSPPPGNKITLGKILSRLKIIISNYFASFRIFFSHGIPSQENTTVYYTSKTQVVFLVITLMCVMVRTLLGFSCLILVVFFKFRRRHLSIDDTIEEFLQMQNKLMPIRYSYSDIKRITEGFKDKLGQGGYGSVYKGKLRSGQLVAVKLLGKSKSDGQDFINEVATIGRIHHVNVVRLIGFCVEGLKQTLIYDFMPNGSLDKIIFSREKNINLSWEKIFEIALGVARGIEYLHQGCQMKILHFDIKPHNILLDENYIPKVSDFGLARLYAIDDSIVSITAARGTLGYIAPELFYKNIGSISHKADVYSFGMLLMEMVGKRRNLDESVDESGQVYFPSWIYERFEKGEDLGDGTPNEKKIQRKMLMVALWCIQMKPVDRPSISTVSEMLESEVELLQIPPKPFQLSFESSSNDCITFSNWEDESKISTLVIAENTSWGGNGESDSVVPRIQTQYKS